MLADSRFHGSTAVHGCILMESYSRPSSSKQAGRKFRSLTSVMVRCVVAKVWQNIRCTEFWFISRLLHVSSLLKREIQNELSVVTCQLYLILALLLMVEMAFW